MQLCPLSASCKLLSLQTTGGLFIGLFKKTCRLIRTFFTPPSQVKASGHASSIQCRAWSSKTARQHISPFGKPVSGTPQESIICGFVPRPPQAADARGPQAADAAGQVGGELTVRYQHEDG